MLVAFQQELASRLQAHRLQTVELLIQMLGSNPNSWFQDFGQPLGAMMGSVNLGAAAGNGPAAIQSFDPIHHSGRVFGDRQIAPPQLFEGADSMFSVVDRLELVAA